MTIYWEMNSHWPSFFGHIFDYYLKPGGAYFGAKMGLRPLSVVFDYYARDKNHGHIRVVNQTMEARRNLQVRVRVYDLDGKTAFDQRGTVAVDAQGVVEAMALPAMRNITPVYFVRCELFDATGVKIVDNVYWQSVKPDNLGPRANDTAFDLKQEQWADLTPLQSMPKVDLEVKGTVRKAPGGNEAIVTLHNPTRQIAFFVRAEITGGKDGNEILPITYDNNYVTVFPGETVQIRGQLKPGDSGRNSPWLRVEGVNMPKQLVAPP
jgi:exo-1,4-beta-D-glucosaminidase